MILLFSGGIDSYIAWHYLHKPPTIYFNLNSKYSSREEKYVTQLIPSTIIESCIDLSTRESGDKAYIPFRNLYLAMLAAKYSSEIVIAGLKDDNVSDKNEKIFTGFSSLLSTMQKSPINVISPFWNMTKEDIIDWYLKEGYSSDELLKTISCYHPSINNNYCGACPSCFRKWCALYVNGIKLEFFNFELMRKYYISATNGKYNKSRNISIIKAVEAYRNRY